LFLQTWQIQVELNYMPMFNNFSRFLRFQLVKMLKLFSYFTTSLHSQWDPTIAWKKSVSPSLWRLHLIWKSGVRINESSKHNTNKTAHSSLSRRLVFLCGRRSLKKIDAIHAGSQVMCAFFAPPASALSSGGFEMRVVVCLFARRMRSSH